MDISNDSIGATLQQHGDNDWEPFAFFSKKLNPAEAKYSTLIHTFNKCVFDYVLITEITRTSIYICDQKLNLEPTLRAIFRKRFFK